MHFKDLFAAGHVRPVEDDSPVESTWSQERGIEDVGPVGGGDDDYVGVGVKAIHLDQDLVEGLFSLVVGSTKSGAPVSAHGIDFVDEHDAGGVALGLIKEVTHSTGPNADKHLYEFGA